MTHARFCGAVVLIVVHSFVVPHLNADDDIAALIDQLAAIDTPGTGYAEYFSGSDFLPYDDAEQIGTLIIGATGERSPVMRKIVAAGFDAVPELLKHLSDERKVDLPPIESGGPSWIAFMKECDYNRATTVAAPQGVNVDGHAEGRKRTDRHEVTVGDLCFVALGQIVNRNWSAVRYQPTGGRIISSPTYSTELRQAILAEWGALTREDHRRRLIDDFRKPDSEYRIIGAYFRLSLYYPEEVEKLVLELLERPVADASKAREFTAQLTEIEDAAERRRQLDEIIRQHGAHYRGAIQSHLFKKLKYAGREQFGAKLTPEELLARRVLHETFDWPEPARFADWGKMPEMTFDNYQVARIIESLTHDESLAIGQRVQAIMESDRLENDSDMMKECLTCLASRPQFGDFLADRLRQVDFQTATQEHFSGYYLAAIARSKSPAVQAELETIVIQSRDPELFTVAANVLTPDSWENVLARAREVLSGLPPDTKDGRQLLELIVERAPSDAEAILVEFLKPNTPSRCNTVCEVLWYGNPLSQKVLVPLLDDDRSIPGVRQSVRDRAASAISHSIEAIEFDSLWFRSSRDAAIQKIKEHCAANNSP